MGGPPDLTLDLAACGQAEESRCVLMLGELVSAAQNAAFTGPAQAIKNSRDSSDAVQGLAGCNRETSTC